MDTASQPGDLVLPLRAAEQTRDASLVLLGLPLKLSHELWTIAEADTCGLTLGEFAAILASVGTKLNFGQPPGTHPDAAEKLAFLRSLRLPELALAHACALGREPAWQRFIDTYRTPLTQAAIAITGSATLGHDLADSLYSELYGLTRTSRRTPFATRLLLRPRLAPRLAPHHPRPAPRRPPSPHPPRDPARHPRRPRTPPSRPTNLQLSCNHLTQAVARTLQTLASEDRFLLSSYFLDRQTLLQISRILNVHEATISRRLKRLVADLRKQLLHNLQSGGLSKRAAEEALGTDPRDIEINLRTLLQTSQADTFFNKTSAATTAEFKQP